MSGIPSHAGDERSVLLHAVAEESLTADQERRLAEKKRRGETKRGRQGRFD